MALRDGPHPAIADTALVGPAAPGDEVLVNVAARELGLGSGGFDIVHANLTRGLDAPAKPVDHVLKLNYTSLQHAVQPVDPPELPELPRRPVAILALHSQLAPVAWAFAQHAPTLRLGFVQTPGGALPASHSRVARELRARNLLAEHLTAGQAFGGPDGDAITTSGRLPTRSRSPAGTPRSPAPGPASREARPRSVTADSSRSTPRTPRCRSASRRSSFRGAPTPIRARATGASPTTPRRCCAYCWRRSRCRRKMTRSTSTATRAAACQPS